jgi:calcineurin-like phosphoesterase family protein
MEWKKGILRIRQEEKVWFTADTHFGHRNIIRYCQRPFATVEEMNETIIDNWNGVVGKDDVVFHLGDFSVGGAAEWTSLLESLNGRIFLVLGNHDMNNVDQGFMRRFENVSMQMLISIGKQRIYLNHYPFLCYGGSYRGTWQLFGHVHTSPCNSGLDNSRLGMLFPTQYDVGVDNNSFTPVSFEEVEIKIQNQVEDKMNLR